MPVTNKLCSFDSIGVDSGFAIKGVNLHLKQYDCLPMYVAK
jgi:hypothetical protein